MTQNKQAVSQQVKLPAFTEVIKVEVPVEAIHQKLLAEFPEDYKHKAIVAHAIIGSARDLSYIYNALNGYPNTIDFEVGEVIMCTETDRLERYNANVEKENGEPLPIEIEGHNWKYRSVEIGRCLITAVDLYRNDKLTVEFMAEDRYSEGKPKKQTVQVNHKSCTKWGSEVTDRPMPVAEYVGK